MEKEEFKIWANELDVTLCNVIEGIAELPDENTCIICLRRLEKSLSDAQSLITKRTQAIENAWKELEVADILEEVQTGRWPHLKIEQSDTHIYVSATYDFGPSTVAITYEPYSTDCCVYVQRYPSGRKPASPALALFNKSLRKAYPVHHYSLLVNDIHPLNYTPGEGKETFYDALDLLEASILEAGQ